MFSALGVEGGDGSVCISLPCTVGWGLCGGHSEDLPCLFALSQGHCPVLLMSNHIYLSDFFHGFIPDDKLSPVLCHLS